MLAVKGHMQTHSSPGWLVAEGVALIVIIIVTYLLRRPSRLDREARRMVRREKRRS